MLVVLKKQVPWQSLLAKLVGKDIVKNNSRNLTKFKVLQIRKNCGQLLDILLVAHVKHTTSLKLMLIHLIVIMQMCLPTIITHLPV